MIIVPAAETTRSFGRQNLVAALAYLTFVPAVLFLGMTPLRHNRLVRFHSMQSIFFTVSLFLAGLLLRLLFSAFALIPRLGYLFGTLAVLIVALGCAILWLVLIIKALQGEMFKVPIIGHFAEKA
ncbi:MAG TPA: DUF4870 domain-containing protein [Terriglobales bacterium]|nr:DUF4870 domain-containing protein [Terriglobales bacterium]